MDPVTVGTVLLAIVSGAAGKAGERLWNGVAALVRRPFARRGISEDEAGPAGGGSAELAALEKEPHNQERAVMLAEALVARADADTGFRQELEAWWKQASVVRTGEGDVTNTISGGTQNGPVLQGRDFTGLTFGVTPSGEPRSSG
jgi:hypothetical protein